MKKLVILLTLIFPCQLAVSQIKDSISINSDIQSYTNLNTNIWYASSGFLFATTTGFLRIANNKHYTSDVLTGAGIGIGVVLAVSYWSPFKSVSFGKNKTHALIYPQIGTNYGIGLLIKN